MPKGIGLTPPSRTPGAFIPLTSGFLPLRSPSFHITHLEPGLYYGVELLAYNEKGESGRVRVPVYTLQNPEKQSEFIRIAPNFRDIKPYLPIIYGAVGGLLLIVLLITVILSCRRTSGTDARRQRNQQQAANGRGRERDRGTGTAAAASNGSDDNVEKNPDLIPMGECGWMDATSVSNN